MRVQIPCPKLRRERHQWIALVADIRLLFLQRLTNNVHQTTVRLKMVTVNPDDNKKRVYVTILE